MAQTESATLDEIIAGLKEIYGDQYTDNQIKALAAMVHSTGGIEEAMDLLESLRDAA